MNIFLTIAIPTYNRADKLKRLLSQFSHLKISEKIKSLGIEILISNNASTDLTKEIANSFEQRLNNNGFYFTYVDRKENLGLDGNMLECYVDAKGGYVWYFSDDDILIEPQFEELIEDITKYNSSIIISNFNQGGYYPFDNIVGGISFFKGNEVEAIKCISKFPKLTIYVIRKLDLSPYIDEIRSYNGSYYLFIALSILVYYKMDCTFLLRHTTLAETDEKALTLRYSPRIFANRKITANKILLYLSRDMLAKQYKDTPLKKYYFSLLFVLYHYIGKHKLSADILKNEHSFLIKSSISLPYNIILFIRQVIKNYSLLIFYKIKNR